MAKFDHFEKLLERTLGEYEEKRKRGQVIIAEMVKDVQEKLEKSVMEKSMKSSQMV